MKTDKLVIPAICCCMLWNLVHSMIWYTYTEFRKQARIRTKTDGDIDKCVPGGQCVCPYVPRSSMGMYLISMGL